MILYPSLIFLHVLAAVLMFAGWTIQSVALAQLGQSTTVEHVKIWMRMRRRSGLAARAAMMTALITGMGMMALRWGPQPWTVAALAALVLIVVLGIAVERRPGRLILRALSEDADRLPAVLPSAVARLTFSLRLRVAIGIAILGLMTVKPATVGSVSMIAAAVFIVVAHHLLRGGAAPGSLHPSSRT